MSNGCENCLWADSCDFGRPCVHYAPLNTKEKLDEREEAMIKRRYREEWIEYAEYCEENFF